MTNLRFSQAKKQYVSDTVILLTTLILQWNARSFNAKSQKLKQFIGDMKEKSKIIHIQASWVKSNLEFVLFNYATVYRDREEGEGGGCATLLKQGIPYTILI